MRPLFLLGLAAAGLFAQVQVQIVSPSERVTAGDSMTLVGAALAADGSIYSTNTKWGVDQPSVATIDAKGILTGITLGIVTVTATFGNLSHSILIQVVPDHVAIAPPSAQLIIGDQVQFTATAFDKKGNPLPRVNFIWAVTNNDDDGTPNVPYGRISSNGMLTGAYEGSAYVRAMYVYTSPTGGVEAGMESRIPIYAPFLTSAPRPFQLTRLFNATQQQRQNPVLRSRPSPLWTTPDGKLLFNASLDGIGTALMAWDGSTFQPVVTAGTPSNAPASIVTDLGRHAVAANGTMLTQQSATDGTMNQIGTMGALQPLLVTNASAPNAEALCCFNLTRNSLSSGGYFVFTGSFRVPGTNTFVSGIFRGQGMSVNEILFSQLDNLPELGVSGVTVSDFGVDNNGVAWYTASLPGKATLYRHDFTGRKKFLAVGDPLLGSTVKSFSFSRNSSPGIWFAENGDVVIGVQLNNNFIYLLRYTGSDPSQPAATLRIDNGAAPLSYQSDGSVLFYGNPDPNRGDGAWLWNGSSLQQVVLIGKTLVNGQPIQGIESGVLDSKGQITLMVSTAASPMVVIRASVGGAPQVLFQAGDAVGVQVPSVLAGFVIGGREGNPMLLAGSTTSASIAEWRDGDVRPVLSLGDQVLGATTPFTGITPYGYTQRTANGDLYSVISSVGIGHYANGAWDVALRFPVKLEDGSNAGGPYRISVNNSGALAWISGTDKGEQRVYLTQNGQNQLICSNGVFSQAGAVIDGHNIFSCDDFLLDDNGRVIIRVHFQNDPVQRTYVWNNGSWQLAVQLNSTQVGGRTVTGLNQFRAIGPHIYAALQTDAGTFIVEWTDAGWSTLYRPTDLMPTGVYLNSVFSYLEANPSGDIVFINSEYPSQGIYFQRGGTLSTVLTTGRPTPDGDFLVNIQGLDLRDDGTIYLLALNQNDELVFYVATPVGLGN